MRLLALGSFISGYTSCGSDPQLLGTLLSVFQMFAADRRMVVSMAVACLGVHSRAATSVRVRDWPTFFQHGAGSPHESRPAS